MIELFEHNKTACMLVPASIFPNTEILICLADTRPKAACPWATGFIRSGKINGILTEERISKLNALNMRWDSVSDMNWEKNYAAAVEYSEKYGEFNPKANYVTENGIRFVRTDSSETFT